MMPSLKIGRWEVSWVGVWGWKWRQASEPMLLWSVWHLGPFLVIEWVD